MHKGNLKGTAVAGALAAMFVGYVAHAAAPPAAKDDKATTNTVKCTAANACKGQSACKTAKNECKGKNTCKGTGFTMEKTEKDCTDKGGTVDAVAKKDAKKK